MAEGWRHETRDVSARVPVWVAVGMLVFLPVAVALVAGLMLSVWAPEAVELPDWAAADREPPAPRLQAKPEADLAALRARWDKRLSGAGWVDRETGVVHIPIEQAMDHVAETGGQPRGETP